MTSKQTTTRRRWYVGHTGGRFQAFTAQDQPTETSHGDRYVAVIGPFDTKRAAIWAETVRRE